MQTERYKLCLLDNNDYLGMRFWPCIQFKNRQILNYFMKVKAAFLHLYILDKGISFLLASSFPEPSSHAWSGDFWWLQLIDQDKNSLDAVLKSSCSADIIIHLKLVFKINVAYQNTILFLINISQQDFKNAKVVSIKNHFRFIVEYGVIFCPTNRNL